LYTHYLAVFVILAENLFVIACLARRYAVGRWQPEQPRFRFVWHWLAVQAALALSFAPWLPVAVYQTWFHQMSWMAPLSAAKVAGTLLSMVLGDAGRGPVGAVAFAAPSLGIVLVIWQEWKARQWGRLSGYAFALTWLLVPLATISLLSLVYPLFQYKQTLMLLAPLLVLLAAALVKLPRLVRVVLAGVLAWFVVGSLGTMYRVETKDGWREAGAYIQARHEDGDVLYLNPAAGMLPLEAYLGRPLPHEGYPSEYDVRTGGWEGELVTAGAAEREMTALAAEYGRVWLVEYGPEFWDPEGYVLDWLQRNAHELAARRFGRIDVRLYEFTQRTAPQVPPS
jgi:hypothetical protein